ncbi:MAG TPA: CHY zinc finger protein [Bacillales bacterium]|nr:CHY zinc finger protein [Bacillales bacterium]
MRIHGIEVKGNVLDEQTRCSHYHTEQDIIAIKFACCQTYYPCYQCHRENADHPVKVWEASRFDEKAVLCGNCGHELTIREYLNAHSACTECGASFNPGCHLHHHLYFEKES